VFHVGTMDQASILREYLVFLAAMHFGYTYGATAFALLCDGSG